MIDTVVFDLGGVLMEHNMPQCLAAFRRLVGTSNMERVLGLTENGEAASDTLMEQYERGEVSTDYFVSHILPFCHCGTERGHVIDAWNIMHAGISMRRWNQVMDLKHQGYRLYVLSNNNDIHWNDLLSLYPKHMQEAFEQCFLSHVLHCTKPQPEIFLKVQQAIACDPDTVVFVDDIEVNRLAAEKNAGWHTCASIDELYVLLSRHTSQ